MENNLQLMLLSAMIKEGSAGFDAFALSGLTKDTFDNKDAERLYGVCIEHLDKYKGVPSKEVIYSKTDLILPETAEPLSFYIAETKNIKLEEMVLEGLGKIALQHQAQKDPTRLVHLLEDLTVKARLNNLMSQEDFEYMNDIGPDAFALYEKFETKQTGITTPWKTLNKVTGGLWPQDLWFLAARNGLGKCVEESSVILDTYTGVNRTVKQIVGDNKTLSVPTWSKENGIHPMVITDKVDTGYKECLEFTLRTGKKIKVTPEHPFLTAEGWKRADQFIVGESVATPAKMPFPLEPVRLKDEEVDLLAIFLADGSCTSSSVVFTKTDPFIVDIAKKAGETLGAAFRTETKGQDAGRNHYFTANGNEDGNTIRNLLKIHGLDGVLSKNKVIPEAIFRLPKEQLSRFISIFWMCDGYVSPDPEITLASEKLLNQLQHLLLRFGIQSTVAFHQATCNGELFDSWRLRVITNSHELFKKEIPLYGHRAEALAVCCSKKQELVMGQFNVSPQWTQNILEKCRVKTKAGATFNKLRGNMRNISEVLDLKCRFEFRNMYSYNNLNSNRVKPHYFKLFCEEMGVTEEYSWLYSSDIFWDEIVSIKNVGVQKVYDLTVEPAHCFVANDIIVHNTWFSMNLLLHFADVINVRTLLVSPEMTRERLALRLASIRSKISYTRILAGELTQDERVRLHIALCNPHFKDNIAVVSSKKFNFVVDGLGPIIKQATPNVVIIDGFYLMKTAAKVSRLEQAPMVADAVKHLAIHYNLPFFNTTQFSKDVDSADEKTVTGKGIALTDVINWHSTCSLGLFQTPEMKNSKTMRVKFLKAREGAADDFSCWWDHDKMDFSEIANDKEAKKAIAKEKLMEAIDDPFSKEEAPVSKKVKKVEEVYSDPIIEEGSDDPF